VKETESGLLNNFIPGLLSNLEQFLEDISPYLIVSILKKNKFLKLGQISSFFKKLIEAKNEQVKFLQKEIQFVRRKNNEDLKQYNILKTEEFTIEVILNFSVNEHDAKRATCLYKTACFISSVATRSMTIASNRMNVLLV
jgi:hypothetical protein